MTLVLPPCADFVEDVYFRTSILKYLWSTSPFNIFASRQRRLRKVMFSVMSVCVIFTGGPHVITACAISQSQVAWDPAPSPDMFKLVHLGTPWPLAHMGTPWPGPCPPDMAKLLHYVAHTSSIFGKRPVGIRLKCLLVVRFIVFLPESIANVLLLLWQQTLLP